MRIFISLVLAFFFFALVARADIVVSGSSSLRNLGYSLEPLVGYEQVYRSTPTSHTKTRSFRGLRLIVGSDKLAGEGEYTKGEDTENFSVTPQSITNKDDVFMVGARTTWLLRGNLFVGLRGGGLAARNINEMTTNGNRTSTESSPQYSPYVGVQLGWRFAKNFGVSISSVIIMKDLGDLAKNNYQNSIAFSVGTN